MDTNTPKNNVASSRDIEHMWKERFGLTQAPVERFKIYLNDFEGWETRGELSYYKQFPEFTIQPLENNGGDKKQNEWARGEIGYYYDHGNGTSILGFYYHNTLLEKVSCEIFDGGKKYGSRVEYRSKTAIEYREHGKEQVSKKFKDFRTQDERDYSRICA